MVERNAELVARMISHEFALEQAPEAIRFAIEQSDERDEGGDPR